MPLTASEIRRKYLEFFAEQAGHTIVPSSPVVPLDDPTLLFTNAGMNQFKDVFLGQGTRPYTRAVDTQKCIRAGGKHNDLEDVGRDTYHHTFFEMLGNWSFGDYFKPEAIEWAWKLLTEVYGIDGDRIYASYFGGNTAAGLESDEEARELWRRHLPAERILPFDMKDNFWEMGETGPCGPCSEIHFDRVGGRDASSIVNEDDPNVLEVWNLVFIQYNREADGTLVPLPARHVDTGMGFERLTSVLQDKPSNYDTDLWSPVFESIRSRCDAPAYEGTLEGHADIAYRVIADHARCLTSALADGAAPGSDGRSYVLRRILRRAVRHGHQTFGAKDPFLADIVPSVVETLGEVFPEMRERMDRIQTVITAEEEAFRRTLDRGLTLFADAADRSSRSGEKVVSGADAFRLHDTFGFPIDLTEVMAEERGMTVDLDGYEQLMEEARETSRSGSDETDLVVTMPPDVLARLEDSGVTPADDGAKFETTSTTSTIRAIWDGASLLEHADPGRRIGLLLDRTTFYGEQGGQVGDQGRIVANGDPGGLFIVEDTRRVGDHVLHVGHVESGGLDVGETVDCRVDEDRRDDIRRNHTATHMLNLALREVAGRESDQRGSMVAPDRLRFDYAATQPLTPEQLCRVEELVRDGISGGLPVDTAIVPLENAKQVDSVRAIFGEQYPDPVRMVSIGATVEEMLSDPHRKDWMDLSAEFCGGTHLENTSEAGEFVLLSEQGLAAGVRRVVALTGEAARTARAEADAFGARIKALSTDESAEGLPTEVDGLVRDFEEANIGTTDRIRLGEGIERLRKAAKKARKAVSSANKGEMVERAREIAESSDGPVVIARMDGADKDSLLAAMDTIRGNREEVGVLLLAVDEDAGKVVIVSRVPDNLIASGLKAGDWVKVAAQACGGGGGGRPDSAQAGGKDPSRADEALEAAREHASKVL